MRTERRDRHSGTRFTRRLLNLGIRSNTRLFGEPSALPHRYLTLSPKFGGRRLYQEGFDGREAEKEKPSKTGLGGRTVFRRKETPAAYKRISKANVKSLVLNSRQPFRGISKSIEFKTAPIHQMKEQAAHAPIGRIEIVQHAATLQFATAAAKEKDGQLLGIMVAMQHA